MVLRQNNGRKENCVITVFLAMTFICMITLIFAFIESAHTAGCRYYLQNAGGAATDSLFSEYSKELWDEYRLVFLIESDEEKLTGKFAEYMKPYAEADNICSFETAEATISELSRAPDGGGEWFEQEILDYMKYGVFEEMPDSLWDEIKEAEAIESIESDYSDTSKAALEVEEVLEKIDSNIKDQRELKAAAIAAIAQNNSGTFISKTNSLSSRIRTMERLIDEYETKADALAEKINAADDLHKSEYGELSDEGKRLVDGNLSSLKNYSHEDADRRKDVCAYDDGSEENIRIISSCRELIDEIDKEIEEERDAIRNASPPSAQPFPEPDYSPVISLFRKVEIPDMRAAHGVENKEKQKLIKEAKKLLSGDILSMLLPEGRKVSDKKTDSEELPSQTANGERSTEERNAAENYLIANYAGRFFSEFTDEAEHPLDYELEYIIGGKESDRDNLSKATGELFALREGLNYLHIMKSSEKRHAAEELATTIVGGSGFPVLIPVMVLLITGVWAAAESAADIKELLSGNKIALFKTEEEWITDIDFLLDIGSGSLPISGDRDNKRGLTYESYLKYLTLLLNSRDRNLRMEDIIQINMQKTEKNFLMKDAIYGAKLKVSAKVNHVFAIHKGFTLETNISKAY